MEALLAKVKTIAQAPVAVAGVPTSSHHHDHAVAKLLEVRARLDAFQQRTVSHE